MHSNLNIIPGDFDLHKAKPAGLITKQSQSLKKCYNKEINISTCSKCCTFSSLKSKFNYINLTNIYDTYIQLFYNFDSDFI